MIIFSDVLQSEIVAMAAAEASIRANRELSDFGKKGQLDRLEAQRAALRQKALNTLKDDLSRATKEAYSLTRERQAATERAARSWDFNRLNYLGLSITGAINAARPGLGISKADAIRAEWQRAIDSADNHAARAWGEVGSAYLLSKFPGDMEISHLAGEMAAKAKEISTTPELQKIAGNETALANTVLKLSQISKSHAINFGDRDGMFGTNEFSRLWDESGIGIKSHFDAPTGNIQYSVSFPDAAPAGEAAPAAGAAV